MLHTIYKFSFIFILVLFFTQFSFTQDKNLQSGKDKIFYSKTNCINDPQPTTIQPPSPKFSAVKTQILAELEKARLNHDTQKKEKLEARLNEIDNIVPVVSYIDGSVQSSGLINKEVGADFDYTYSTIASFSHWNHAVATVPSGTLAGRIYVAVGQYASTPNSDTVKVYSSTNGGVSWIWQYSWWMPGLNMDCRSNEMDIMIVYGGTTAWLFGLTPINNLTNNNTRTIFWRYNLTTHEFYYITLYWAGSPATNLDYNGRLASDDAIYGSDAFIYITVVSDSIGTGGVHWFRHKFARISTPLASPPSIVYSTGNWWSGSTTNTTLYVYNDIAYIHPGMSRVFTLMNLNMINNDLLLAWSDDLGATVSGSLQLTESTPTRGASLASVVAAGYPRMMIVNRKHFTGIDWDAEYHYTTNGGTSLGSWTNGFISNTSAVTYGYMNVSWVRGSLTDFKATFILDSTNILRAYYAGWNGSAWNSPSKLALSNLQADTVNACPVAGYRIGGGDNCLAIWSNFNQIFASYNCGTTVGINNNNTIPEKYCLYQNYPNPFNPATTIKFEIPKHSFVKLTVYDILGTEVETLVNGEKEPGRYEVTWDGSKYSSGIYFYKLETGDFKETKKMVLIK